MALPLKESRAAGELAHALYEFLPGSGNPAWRGHVSFKSVADKVGVGDYWQQGSKLPMLTALIEKTLEFRRGHSERLIVEVVRAGLVYRRKQDKPVTRSEIEKINGLICQIGFKFPDLWDPTFLSSLPEDSPSPHRADEEDRVSKQREAEKLRLSQQLQGLKDEFTTLHREPDRRRAGLLLEGVLNRLFALYDLSPREPFRVVGEQIDGSFELDHEIYLLEAKWERDPAEIKHLYVFREKVEGKSKFTRGIFISINGVTNNAEEAITRGKQPTFFIVNGYDLMMLLSEDMQLRDFLRRRQRLLAEEGRVSVPYQQLPKS